MNRCVAAKCYGFDWITQLDLDESSAAAMMAAHGVDWALLQNVLDPLPSSGVVQRLPSGRYDDRRFRDHVRDQGMKVYESTAVFFAPQVNRDRPALRPVAEDGSTMEMFDWYLGVSPHSRDYLARRAELLEEVVTTYQPDGVFLSFIRFPGFWEGLTPQVAAEDVHDYGFAAGALQRFEEDTGIELPSGDVTAKARTLLGELRAEWTAWKCAVITEAVAELRAAARRARPGTEVLVNGLAFPRAEGSDVAAELYGQDLGAISEVAEHVETMVYHQILGRPVRPWIDDVVADLRPRVHGTLLACVQTSPAYTGPPHDGLGRSPDLPPEEFVESLRAVAASAADGLSVYHWTDLAANQLRGDGSMAAAVRRYRDGDL